MSSRKWEEKPHWSHEMEEEREESGRLSCDGGHTPRTLIVRECKHCGSDQARYKHPSKYDTKENIDYDLKSPCYCNPIVKPLLKAVKKERLILIEKAKSLGFTKRELQIMAGKDIIEQPIKEEA